MFIELSLHNFFDSLKNSMKSIKVLSPKYLGNERWLMVLKKIATWEGSPYWLGMFGLPFLLFVRRGDLGTGVVLQICTLVQVQSTKPVPLVHTHTHTRGRYNKGPAQEGGDTSSSIFKT